MGYKRPKDSKQGIQKEPLIMQTLNTVRLSVRADSLDKHHRHHKNISIFVSDFPLCHILVLSSTSLRLFCLGEGHIHATIHHRLTLVAVEPSI